MQESKLSVGFNELKLGFILGITNKYRLILCYFLASCSIPFQVLPDYQEGAEQVRW